MCYFLEQLSQGLYKVHNTYKLTNIIVCENGSLLAMDGLEHKFITRQQLKATLISYCLVLFSKNVDLDLWLSM